MQIDRLPIRVVPWEERPTLYLKLIRPHEIIRDTCINAGKPFPGIGIPWRILVDHSELPHRHRHLARPIRSSDVERSSRRFGPGKTHDGVARKEGQDCRDEKSHETNVENTARGKDRTGRSRVVVFSSSSSVGGVVQPVVRLCRRKPKSWWSNGPFGGVILPQHGIISRRSNPQTAQMDVPCLQIQHLRILANGKRATDWTDMGPPENPSSVYTATAGNPCRAYLAASSDG